jgi:hypothetical protein
VDFPLALADAAAALCLTLERGDDSTLIGDWCVPGRLGRTPQSLGATSPHLIWALHTRRLAWSMC